MMAPIYAVLKLHHAADHEPAASADFTHLRRTQIAQSVRLASPLPGELLRHDVGVDRCCPGR